MLHLDEGDIIEEVLGYVHHDSKVLVRHLREKVENALTKFAEKIAAINTANNGGGTDTK